MLWMIHRDMEQDTDQEHGFLIIASTHVPARVCSGHSLAFPKTPLLQLLLVFFLFTVNISLYTGYSKHGLDSFTLKQNKPLSRSLLFELQPFPPPPLFKTFCLYLLTFHSHFNSFQSGSCCHYSHRTALHKSTANLHLIRANGYFFSFFLTSLQDLNGQNIPSFSDTFLSWLP